MDMIDDYYFQLEDIIRRYIGSQSLEFCLGR
jgi:hypothetical protein